MYTCKGHIFTVRECRLYKYGTHCYKNHTDSNSEVELVLVLVLVDNEPVSFSAVRAHILPGLVKSILEHVNCRSIYNMLRQTVPDVDYSVGEE